MLENVDGVNCLGVIIDKKGGSENKIRRRIGQAKSATSSQSGTDLET